MPRFVFIHHLMEAISFPTCNSAESRPTISRVVRRTVGAIAPGRIRRATLRLPSSHPPSAYSLILLTRYRDIASMYILNLLRGCHRGLRHCPRPKSISRGFPVDIGDVLSQYSWAFQCITESICTKHHSLPVADARMRPAGVLDHEVWSSLINCILPFRRKSCLGQCSRFRKLSSLTQKTVGIFYAIFSQHR